MSDIGWQAGERRPVRRRLLVAAAAMAAAVVAWGVLVAMIAGVPAPARAALGPLMELFGGGADLPPALASALAVLCLPAGGPFDGVEGASSAAAMWLAMTVAMMLPPALPGIVAATGRHPASFAAGHLLVWAAAALVGVAAQGLVQSLGALTPLFAPASGAFAGSVLVAAGLYQFTPAKLACLARTRRPPVVAAGAAGRLAALRLGVLAATDGLGCCLGLMAAMFALGLMNLAWLVILTALFAVEKATEGLAVPRAIGAGLVLWGAVALAASPAGLALKAALLGG